MKIRDGFVSNSSSTAFVITNKTDRDKKVLDLAMETTHLVGEFNDEYGHDYSIEQFIQDGFMRGETIPAGESIIAFGDDDGDALGCIFDYMLRDGGETETFKWRFHEMRR